MRVGRLIHRITLENPATAVSDGEGGYTETWAALSPRVVWADIAPASARNLERVAGGAVQGSATHIVTIRYHAGVTLKTRITFKGRTFSVTGMHNDSERNRTLVLTCQELVS